MERIEDVFVYLVDLPDGINEMVTPCRDGHTIYIDARLDLAHRQKAYEHAMWHIEHNDFQKADVQQIEAVAHQAAEKKAEPIPKEKLTNYERKRQRAIRMNHMTDKDRIRSLEGKIRRARLRMMEATDEATYRKYQKKVWESEIRLDFLKGKKPFE